MVNINYASPSIYVRFKMLPYMTTFMWHITPTNSCYYFIPYLYVGEGEDWTRRWLDEENARGRGER